MAIFEVYPEAELRGSEWRAFLKVVDPAGGPSAKYRRSYPAGVTSTLLLSLLKVVFEITVPDGTLPEAVETAVFDLDIKPGGGEVTVWSDWQATAEPIIAGLEDITGEEPWEKELRFWAEWAPNDTNAMRTNIRRAFVNENGWTITSIHQHEGDGTVLEETS